MTTRRKTSKKKVATQATFRKSGKANAKSLSTKLGTPRKTKAASKATSSDSRKVNARRSQAVFGSGDLNVRDIRTSFGLPRNVFSRLAPCSDRAIAGWESGQPLSVQSRQRMIELKRLQASLAAVVKSDCIGHWLLTPNKAFDGLKPLEVIERGETDRIWRMIYLLESGVPS